MATVAIVKRGREISTKYRPRRFDDTCKKRKTFAVFIFYRLPVWKIIIVRCCCYGQSLLSPCDKYYRMMATVGKSNHKVGEQITRKVYLPRSTTKNTLQVTCSLAICIWRDYNHFPCCRILVRTTMLKWLMPASNVLKMKN